MRVLLALALLPRGTAMGFGTEPEGIIYSSGEPYVMDPVKYCSGRAAYLENRDPESRVRICFSRRRQRLHDGVEC